MWIGPVKGWEHETVHTKPGQICFPSLHIEIIYVLKLPQGFQQSPEVEEKLIKQFRGKLARNSIQQMCFCFKSKVCLDGKGTEYFVPGLS